MKKFISFIFFILVIINIVALVAFVKYLFNKPQNTQDKVNQPEQEVLGLPDNLLEFNLDHNNKSFLILGFIVKNQSNIGLYSNLDKLETARNIKQSKNCESLVNAGFYTKEHDHIGLFISNQKQISNYQKNPLFNGILSINTLNTPRITHELPQDKLVYALQSGPIIIENTFPKNLSLSSDKYSRRVIAAINGNNQLMFFVIYEKNNSQNGPLLSDLPQIVNKLNQDHNLNIADAINLDGGSASAFIHGSKKLVEISPIGGYFCIK